MPTIKVYSNKFSDEAEHNECPAGISVRDYFAQHINGYAPDMDNKGYFSLTRNGLPFPPSQWHELLGTDDVICIYFEPKGTVLLATLTIGSLIASVAAMRNMDALNQPDNYNTTTPDSSSIYSVNAQGNQPKLMAPVPVLFGRHKVYPDVISPSFRRYVNHEEWRYFLLAVAAHQVAVADDEWFIADTPVVDLGADVELQLFQPGENVTGHVAHAHMYSVAEVDGAGVELKGDLPTFEYVSPYTPGEWTYQWRVEPNTKKLQLCRYGANGSDGEVTSITYNTTVDWRDFLPPEYSDTEFVGVVLKLQIGQQYEYFRVVEGGSVPTFQRVHAGIWTVDESWNGFGAEGDLLFGYFEIINSGDFGAPAGWYAATPRGAETSLLELDFHFPEGLTAIDDEGIPRSRTVDVLIEYRNGSTGTILTHNETFSEGTVDARAWTVPLSVSPGAWQVRCRVTSITHNKTLTKERLQWNGLRSELDTASSYPYAAVAIAIKGTQRLSSAASNKINCIAQGVHPVLQSDLTWSAPVATRSVTAAVGYIAKAAGNDDTQINLDELYRIGQILDERGDYFDGVFDKETTAWEALKRVLAIGWTQPVVDYGQILPVRDAQTTELGWPFSEQNMTSGITEHIEMPSVLNEKHDGVEIEFIDKRTYKSATILVTLDDQAGLNPEKKRIYGLVDDATNPVRAIRMGLRYLRTLKYRNRTYEFSTEQDALECKLHDPAQIGWAMPHRSQTGEVKSVTGDGAETTLLLTEPVTFTDGQTHTIIVSSPEGKATGPYTCTATADPYQITLDRALEFTPEFTGRIERPRYQFGTATRRSLKTKIRKAVPRGTDSVAVECVIDDARVYDSDNYGLEQS